MGNRQWLKDARAEANLTQKQVADRLKITEEYYWYIEAGQRQKKMEITLAVKLAEILGIPVQKIIDYESAE